MSYTKSFTRKITIHYSGSVNYPASQNGGVKHYDGTVSEDVQVNIEVDTDAFDNSVATCNDSVNGLTASVTAMNAAQCLSITKNADKVSQALIKGFFHSVRTDLSTQRAELEQAITARLGLLREQARSLGKKKNDMQEHYARTSARYLKVFNDLNEELSTNIHKLDESIFGFVDNVGQQSSRMLHTDLVQNAITVSKESNTTGAMLEVATVKNHAMHALEQAKEFLTAKARAEKTLHQTTVEGSGNNKYLIPVCYLETTDSQHQAKRQCVTPDEFSPVKQKISDRIEAEAFNESPQQMRPEEKAQLQSYMQEEIASHVSGTDKHSLRVRELINNMFNKLSQTL